MLLSAGHDCSDVLAGAIQAPTYCALALRHYAPLMFDHYLPRAFTSLLHLYYGLAFFGSPDEMPCNSCFYCEDNDWIWLFANGKDTSQGGSRPGNGLFSQQKVSLDIIYAQYSQEYCFLFRIPEPTLGFANQDLDACDQLPQLMIRANAS